MSGADDETRNLRRHSGDSGKGSGFSKTGCEYLKRS